jgi:hypothetical protein
VLLLAVKQTFLCSTATVQRGDKKISDKCDDTRDCGFDGAICVKDKKSTTCQCLPELTASNHIDKCGKRKYSWWENVTTGFIYETSSTAWMKLFFQLIK